MAITPLYGVGNRTRWRMTLDTPGARRMAWQLAASGLKVSVNGGVARWVDARRRAAA